jgi:molecular chaperone DnaJ
VSRGNHLITVKINIPTKVNSEERELLEKLAVVRGETVAKGTKEGFLGGLFQK